MLTADTTVTWSPPPVPTRASRSIPRSGGRRSEGRELGNVDSNHDCRGQGPADCHYLIPHREPPSGADPDPAPHRGAATAVCGGQIRSVRRLCQSWATSAWSRYPVPTRVIRRTKAEPQPCAAAKLPGLESNQCEPRFRALVGCQQPSRYRVRGPGVESATTTFERTALPIGCTRAWYAASDSNAHLAD